jgi:hypothetical protein
VQHCLAGEEACCLGVFFPYLADLQVDKVEDLGNAVLITARSRAGDAPCHGCGLSSARVNSRYRRRVHDLAAGGRAVMIDLEVRRFFCGNPGCELRTFAEQVPAVTRRHQPPAGPAPGVFGPRRSARRLVRTACTLHTAGSSTRQPCGHHQLKIFNPCLIPQIALSSRERYKPPTRSSPDLPGSAHGRGRSRESAEREPDPTASVSGSSAS